MGESEKGVKGEEEVIETCFPRILLFLKEGGEGSLIRGGSCLTLGSRGWALIRGVGADCSCLFKNAENAQAWY